MIIFLMIPVVRKYATCISKRPQASIYTYRCVEYAGNPLYNRVNMKGHMAIDIILLTGITYLEMVSATSLRHFS